MNTIHTKNAKGNVRLKDAATDHALSDQDLAKKFQKVGVIITGHVAKRLQPNHGVYFEMFSTLFAAILPQAKFYEFDVIEGQWPQNLHDMDLYVISGSKHSVYEDLPWIHKLKTRLSEMVDQRIPLLGVCFGHQILAEVLGGKVTKYKDGWRIGMIRYTLLGQGELCTSERKDLAASMLTIHQDQVMQKPPSGTVLASAEHCTIAGLDYAEIPVVSIQAHPEFSVDYLAALLRERKELFPEKLYTQAQTGLEELSRELPVDRSKNLENAVEVVRQLLFLLAMKS